MGGIIAGSHERTNAKGIPVPALRREDFSARAAPKARPAGAIQLSSVSARGDGGWMGLVARQCGSGEGIWGNGKSCGKLEAPAGEATG